MMNSGFGDPHKSEHRTAESAGWIGRYDKPSGNRSECCRRKKQKLALSEQNLVTVLTMLRKHLEEFRKLEGQNAVEIENNLQAMKTRKSELDQEAIDAKKALERFQNQNASLNSAAEALKSRFRDSKIFQKKNFQRQWNIWKQRRQRHQSFVKNTFVLAQ